MLGIEKLIPVSYTTSEVALKAQELCCLFGIWTDELPNIGKPGNPGPGALYVFCNAAGMVRDVGVMPTHMPWWFRDGFKPSVDLPIIRNYLKEAVSYGWINLSDDEIDSMPIEESAKMMEKLDDKIVDYVVIPWEIGALYPGKQKENKNESV